jgi:uncharacterized protein YkwD
MLIRERAFRGEMKNKTNVKLAAIVLSLVFIVGTAGFFGSKASTQASASSMGFSQKQALDQVNDFRKENNLPVLIWNDKLAKAAQDKLQDEDNLNYFDHTSPVGKQAWDFILNDGYDYKYAGENLAIDFNSVSDAMDAWKQSPSHRENMLSDKYEEFGFASMNVDINGEKSVAYVQMFGTSYKIYDRIF